MSMTPEEKADYKEMMDSLSWAYSKSLLIKDIPLEKAQKIEALIIELAEYK